jgi:type 1 glutamine amidotransferase
LDAGFEVELVNNLERIKNADPIEGLNSFHVVIFHGKLEQRDDSAVQALKDFVHGGKGLLVLHIASASFAPDPASISREWRELVGSVWVYAPPGDPQGSFHPEPPLLITVTLDEPTHPILAGIPSEFTFAKEELYQNMAPASDGPGLCLATGRDVRMENEQKKESKAPVAYALERGNGRVFNMYLGHYVSTHVDWRFQKMITQAVEWAARS